MRGFLLAGIVVICLLMPLASAQTWTVDERFSGADCEFVQPNGILLTWQTDSAAISAGESRAEALTAEPCSQFIHNSPVNAPAELDLLVENVDDGLFVRVNVTVIEDLAESVNLRLLITVDNNAGQNGVVRHYQWSAGFYHSAGESTDWNRTIDVVRLQEDEIPIENDQKWRLTVIALLVDDLDNSIHAATSSEVVTASSVPPRGEAIPVVLAFLAILGGLLAVILADRNREVGLPRVVGKLVLVKQQWMAQIEVRAGGQDVKLKGGYADAPWKIQRAPKSDLISAGNTKRFDVRMRCSEEVLPEAHTHWEFEVEELGGWVLDLKLIPPIILEQTD